MTEFTANVFHDAFCTLGKWCEPKASCTLHFVFLTHMTLWFSKTLSSSLRQVLYPTIVMPENSDGSTGLIEYTRNFKHVFVSLNR
jgi:hypothetical protein